ncbi:hypothetical protein [Breoghania sp.]|uniref:hypothetical protein n=1 Tax=Breoghania sp. TaxID=2065378 RepID=UPI002629FC2A|nr:hypothetical protein [Breoghania sp.]MDJ0930483.1 hypothetical protein [Breoghania sp.]
MDLTFLLDRFPEPAILACGGLFIGLLFGTFAQQSRFCLRAAVIEFVDAAPGAKLAIWLLTFSIAVLGTQLLVLADQAQLSEARQIASRQRRHWAEQCSAQTWCSRAAAPVVCWSSRPRGT